MKRAALFVSISLMFMLTACATSVNLPSQPGEPGSIIGNITLPEGFSIDIYAKVPGARSLALSDKGTLFVGTREGGRVYAVLDEDGDKKGEKVIVIASGLTMPNGVALKDGDLYVAEVSRVIKFDDIENNLNNASYEIINDQFPSDLLHGWKFIRFGPDGKLYVPVGAPCNICNRGDPYAGIFRMDPDGKNLEMYARGIRNTVGFDWDPATGELWFTDNGRDLMGEDIPPDELNHAPDQGMNFGYPYCYGKGIQDPEFTERGCKEFTAPALELGPHVASLGMRFYTGDMFPENYRGGIFIAEHGSWNRRVPIGYRVMFVKLQDNAPASYDVFAEGWLQGEETIGRPVDIQQMPDSSILVSDDHAGLVYRITYSAFS